MAEKKEYEVRSARDLGLPEDSELPYVLTIRETIPDVPGLESTTIHFRLDADVLRELNDEIGKFLPKPDVSREIGQIRAIEEILKPFGGAPDRSVVDRVGFVVTYLHSQTERASKFEDSLVAANAEIRRLREVGLLAEPGNFILQHTPESIGKLEGLLADFGRSGGAKLLWAGPGNFILQHTPESIGKLEAERDNLKAAVARLGAEAVARDSEIGRLKAEARAHKQAETDTISRREHSRILGMRDKELSEANHKARTYWRILEKIAENFEIRIGTQQELENLPGATITALHKWLKDGCEDIVKERDALNARLSETEKKLREIAENKNLIDDGAAAHMKSMLSRNDALEAEIEAVCQALGLPHGKNPDGSSPMRNSMRREAMVRKISNIRKDLDRQKASNPELYRDLVRARKEFREFLDGVNELVAPDDPDRPAVHSSLESLRGYATAAIQSRIQDRDEIWKRLCETEDALAAAGARISEAESKLSRCRVLEKSQGMRMLDEAEETLNQIREVLAESPANFPPDAGLAEKVKLSLDETRRRCDLVESLDVEMKNLGYPGGLVRLGELAGELMRLRRFLDGIGQMAGMSPPVAIPDALSAVAAMARDRDIARRIRDADLSSWRFRNKEVSPSKCEIFEVHAHNYLEARGKILAYAGTGTWVHEPATLGEQQRREACTTTGWGAIVIPEKPPVVTTLGRSK